MRYRQSKLGLGPAPLQTKLAPGELVTAFAAKRGWPFGICNVMFEGVTDIAYLEIANERYHSSCGLHLIGPDLSVFAVGEREEGGTENLIERLRTLKSLMQDDPFDGNGNSFRVLAVVDDDHAGRKTLNSLVKNVGLVEYQDVIRLRHYFPFGSQDPHDLKSRIEKANLACKDLDCEIEDFISRDLLDSYANENQQALVGGPAFMADVYHYNWAGHLKPGLARHVRSYATIKDVGKVVDFVKFLRFLLRLPPNGV